MIVKTNPHLEYSLQEEQRRAMPSKVLLVAFLLIAPVIAAHAQSARVVLSGDQRFHFTEKPGPDAVGVKVVEQYDFSRGYRPVTDELGKPYSTGKRVGFHAFRRYRAAVLRKGQVPEDLITLWLGHARTLTDRYAAQLREDQQYRSAWCKRAGLGFTVVPLLHSDAVSTESVIAA